MKKIVSYLFIFAFVLIFLAACKPASEHTTHVDSDGDGLCDICHENLVLATPVVSLSEEGLASWNAVEGASSYIYKLNGEQMATMKTSLQLADGDKFSVKAVASAPYSDSAYSAEVTYVAPYVPHYGLPLLEEGFYMRDADVLQDGNLRYLVYTTNETKAGEDNVIALRVGEKADEGWVYGDQMIILRAGGAGAWDQFIGSASLVKGNFNYQGQSYNYLLAYQATELSTNNANQIGLAVGNNFDEEFVKVGDDAIVKYDSSLFGANMVGVYAPSLVNYNKASGIRLFYTLADAYGHFAYFVDFDASDLGNIKLAKAMITNQGDLQSGDPVTMFPNADFAYDAANNRFYAVKDVSPSPTLKPSFADEFELCYLAEEELYTTDPGLGWVSVDHQDFFDLGTNRAYSACIVSDAYGHVLNQFEIVYNDCELGADYLFTQYLRSYIA